MIHGANSHPQEPPPTLLSIKDVTRRVGLSRATIYHKVNSGDFPKSVRISQARVAWLESEVSDWILEKVENRGAK